VYPHATEEVRQILSDATAIIQMMLLVMLVSQLNGCG
jgi:hypothetical protein